MEVCRSALDADEVAFIRRDMSFSEVASLLHRAVSGWTLFVTARLVSRHLGRVVSPATGDKFDVRVFRCLFPCCTLLLIHYLYTDRSALTQIQQDSEIVGAVTGNRK